MKQSFFSHPLWQKFQNVPITVFRLSDGEHRLRDAYANFLLKEFLPPNTRFETCTVAAVSTHRTPLPKDIDVGIVVVGRPSLFSRAIRDMLDDIQPQSFYEFGSENPRQTADYRSIIRKGLPKSRSNSQPIEQKLRSKTFAQQRKNKSRNLYDNAIVYSGWRGKQPLILLAGSSTVSTWGAVHYVTKPPREDDTAIWQEDIQGVIQAEVNANDAAFDEVESQKLELLSPARFWFEGGKRPPVNGWNRETLELHRSGGPVGMDFRILVNGHAFSIGTYAKALVLLAWLSNRVVPYGDGFSATITSGEALRALFTFLQIRPDYPIDLGETETLSRNGKPERAARLIHTMKDFAASKIGKHVCETLKELTVEIRSAGGLAYAQENPSAPGNEARWTFTLISRPLPHFFPTVR